MGDDIGLRLRLLGVAANVRRRAAGFAERFLFASAYPLSALKPQLERFRKLPWNEDVLPKLFHANAIAALRLDKRDAFRNSLEWSERLPLG